MKNPILSLHQVNKTFKTSERTFTALKNINLQVQSGEYLAITGKSGSGKSTLLNMITGIDRPSAGEVIFNGQSISKLKENELAKWRGQNVGIVFQFFQLIPTLTVAENILLAMEFVNTVPRSERRSRMMQLLERVDIGDQANKMPASLSGGEQQRAAIARALANDPGLLVADEPTGNLDSTTAESINALFKSLSQAGKTVIVVTHQPGHESQYDRSLRMLDGEILNPQTAAL